MRQLLIVLICLMFAGQASAATKTFSGTGSWSGGTWTPSAPVATDDVVIAAGASLNIDTSPTIKSLTTTSGAAITVSGSGSLTVESVTGTMITLTNNVTWSNTGTLTFNCNTSSPPSAISLNYFSGRSMGNTIVNVGDTRLFYVMDSNTFSNLTVNINSDNGYETSFFLVANQTVTNTFTINGNSLTNGRTQRGSISSNAYGTKYTITAGAVVATGNFDVQDIGGAGTANWDFSGIAAGNCGGNTGITFRAPRTFYVVKAGTGSAGTYQDYMNVWATTSGGIPADRYSNEVPLPQDTIVIDNNSFSNPSTGNSWYFHNGNRTGSVDVSALTNANFIAFPLYTYGNLTYTGSGITTPSGNYVGPWFDARLKNEAGTTLNVNITTATGGYDGGIGAMTTVTSNQRGSIGTVKLLSNWNFAGTFKQKTPAVLNLGGKTLRVGTYTPAGGTSTISGGYAYSNTVTDTVGGGIITNGTTPYVTFPILAGICNTVTDPTYTTPSGITYCASGTAINTGGGSGSAWTYLCRGSSDSLPCTPVPYPSPLTISTGTSTTYSATGGVPPYTWSTNKAWLTVTPSGVGNADGSLTSTNIPVKDVAIVSVADSGATATKTFRTGGSAGFRW